MAGALMDERGTRADGRTATMNASEPAPREGRWTFFGESSLPLNPLAREHEKRGRRWLVVSYLLCPCHLPIVVVLLGAISGGTAFGAALNNTLGVGIALTAAYGVVVWRGFRELRRAKRIEGAGGALQCNSQGCSVGAADTLTVS